jgi:hypothetical protein
MLNPNPTIRTRTVIQPPVRVCEPWTVLFFWFCSSPREARTIVRDACLYLLGLLHGGLFYGLIADFNLPLLKIDDGVVGHGCKTSTTICSLKS